MYSDIELADLRRMRAQIRKENDALEKENSQSIRDSLKGCKGKITDSSLLEELVYFYESKQDEDYAYAEPTLAQKNKVEINEVFNKNIAGKNIKWKVGLVSEDKKEINGAVREFSVATGRPRTEIWLLFDNTNNKLDCRRGG